MDKTLQAHSREHGQSSYNTLVKGIARGMLGGLAGTVLMYLFGAGIFALMRWPASTNFTIIGDSASAFFPKLGVALAGGAPLGMLLYCLIGLAMGILWGAAGAGLDLLRQASSKKRVGLSVLYVELLSLPLLATGTLALKMSASSAALWFGISFVMHLVYGMVLGAVTSYGAGGVIQEEVTR